MTTETTRRALFGGAGLVALAAAVPAVASTMSASSSVSPALARLIAVSAEAWQVSEDHDNLILKPADKAAKALASQIPHVAVDIDGDPYWTTANPGAVNVARGLVERDPARNHPNSPGLRRLVAADLQRQRLRTRIHRDTGLTAAVDRSNALNDAYANAESAVATHPVSTVTDLHAKLAFMIKNDMGDGRDWLEEIADDVARIANVEGR
ncbi:hypothetical protein NZL82_10960 [Sphingomonas sanguinis]|uniref:hypothetical protein n=1 Tax=Sphingomonas sp. LC-1 TaxID=3110957 RepID=UPI0021BB1758|nr:hypothetical protein [Sphingomonas sp. LC-1]MCT8002397.1 hypothetical protein [Sphingomonas sp. LC-1]